MRDVAFPGSIGIPVAPPPARLSNGTVDIERPPLLGEHSDEVLAEYGFSAGERDALRQGGTI
jgi:crotonobetainyl-CoA:carnitine CoA-transferase CaiB-like acyl-CoA transferase